MTDKLNELLQQTDDKLLDLNFRSDPTEISWYQSTDQQYWFLNEINLFDINEILPNHLTDEYQHKMRKSHKIDINYMDLFKRMNERENEQINEMLLDLRDSILESCDVSM